MKTNAFKVALVSVVITFAASACASSSASDTAHTTERSTTTTTVDRPSVNRDELVRTESGRMHLRCVGAGTSTVLLIAGWGDGGDEWGGVEPALSERARVCSYARFGTGTSDPQSEAQTFATQAKDLHALLSAAGEPGPYVVAGHSFGGAEAVTFASMYRDAVAGLMLLDASPTGWPATVCTVPAWAGGCAVMREPTVDPERLDVFPAFEQVATITSLGDLPVTVVTAAHRTDPGPSPAEFARLDSVWAAGMDRWANLSSVSRLVTVEDTGHHIEVDRPEVVVEELLEIIP